MYSKHKTGFKNYKHYALIFMDKSYGMFCVKILSHIVCSLFFQSLVTTLGASTKLLSLYHIISSACNNEKHIFLSSHANKTGMVFTCWDNQDGKDDSLLSEPLVARCILKFRVFRILER